MKTAREIANHVYPPEANVFTRRLKTGPLEQMIKEYAQEVTTQALKDAAERVSLGLLSANRKSEARQSILDTPIQLP